MSVQTFEAVTDADGNVRFADTVRLPAHTKVYVVVPAQATSYAQIAPDNNLLPSTIRFPHVRVLDEGLAKRFVKTIIQEAHAEL